MTRLWRVVLLLALLCACDVGSRSQSSPVMPLNQLPREGQQVMRLIAQGGPFRYSRDGVRFGNRERRLPLRPADYYREYTVSTPGERDRGARRIVCGGLDLRAVSDCYYTSDHYASFRKIKP